MSHSLRPTICEHNVAIFNGLARMPSPAASRSSGPHERNQLSPHAWLEIGLVSLLALAVNIPYLGHPPRYDELYHILAAQSWAENGTFQIAEGVYTRAPLFSAITGVMFRLFGYSVEVARVVPILASATLTGLVFMWTRSAFGRQAAWLASMLLTFSVTTMMMSQFARFYSLHALFFFLGAILLFQIIERGPHAAWRLIGAMLSLLACMTIALHLQSTTLIGASALAGWAIARVLAPTVWRLPPRLRVAIPTLAAAIVCVVIAVVYYHTPFLDSLIGTFRHQALWARDSSPLTYHWWLVSSYPVLYGLLPAVIVIALTRNAPATFFCTIVFVTAILIHSLGGMRNQHYVFYLSPFFFIVCAAALAMVPSSLQSLVNTAYSVVLSRRPTKGELHLSTMVLTILMAVFMIACTPAIYRSFKVLATGPYNLHPQFAVDWRAARPALERLADESDVVVTTNSLAALNYLGRHDVEFSATILAETPAGNEFSIDTRTGLPVISTTHSVEQLMRCYRSGLLITEAWQWRHPIYGFNPETAAFIESWTSRVELPANTNLLAYRWENPDAHHASGCPPIRRYSRKPVG